MIVQQEGSTKTGGGQMTTGDTHDNSSDKSVPVVNRQLSQGIYTIATTEKETKRGLGRVPSIRNSIGVQDLSSPAL